MKIENSHLKVEITSQGAELQSLYHKMSEREYLWQGDAKFWKRRAPLLFPFVGCLSNGSYIYEGQTYSMTPHGFARDSLFTESLINENEVEYELESSALTRSNYPFDFSLKVNYRLEDNCLIHQMRVANPGDKDLPFSIGYHPAFNFPIGGEIHFETFMDQCFYLEDGLLQNKPSISPIDQKVLTTNDFTFQRDALIFKHHENQKITLKGEGHDLIVHLNGAPSLGLWAKPGAPYICIEPWYGYADPVGFDGDIFEKPGMEVIVPGQEFNCEIKIEIK